MIKNINFEDKDIKRHVIMHHYSSPLHKPIVKTTHGIIKRKNNTSCMDDIIISLEKTENIIKKCSFDGIACSLATASTDILIDLILNHPVDYAKKILIEYKKMILNGYTNEKELLGELLVFIKAKELPNRMNCVLMGAELLLDLIEDTNQNNS